MKSSVISSSQPRAVAAGDFNNDHQIDIVVANSGTHTTGILLAKGDETFADQQTFPTGAHSHPYSIVVADFSNDTYLDIAVANYGYGNGIFGNEISYPLGYGYHPYSIAVTDVNHDNRMDIVIACYDTDFLI
jgi:hypothetical protein